MKATQTTGFQAAWAGTIHLCSPIKDIQKAGRVLRALTTISPSDIQRMIFEAHQLGEARVLHCHREKGEWLAMQAAKFDVKLSWRRIHEEAIGRG